MKKRWLSIMAIVCVLTTSIQFPGFAISEGNSNYEKIDVATSSDVKEEQKDELNYKKEENIKIQDRQNLDEEFIGVTQNEVEEFEIDEYGILTKYNGNGGDVVIPDRVTSIGYFAFKGCSSLTSIEIPEGVTSIRQGAFSDCSNLVNVYLPNSLKDLGGNTFVNCINLISIEIPYGTKSLYDTFEGCVNLREVILPESIEEIGDGTFLNCRNLKKINVPHSVVSIGYEAFQNCGLTSISLTNVNDIDDKAFYGCTSLIDVEMPETITRIGFGAFYGCSSIKDISIPKGITEIKYETFEKCSSLENIIIPDGTKIIEYYAFKDCNSLVNVVLPDSVEVIEYHVFENCKSLVTIDSLQNVMEIGESTFKNCENLRDIILSENLEYIHQDLFYGCKNLKILTIPKNVIVIEKNAFCNSGLGVVKMSSSVKTIGDFAFSACNIKSIILPDSLTSIGNGVFYNCSFLENIIIPKNVISVGEGIFEQCEMLERVDFEADVREIKKATFRYCKNLKIVNISKSIITIEELAFEHCENLNYIYIPENVEFIGKNAFYNCSNLNSINIPEGVTKLENCVFDNCQGLTSIIIPKSMKNVGSNAFNLCNSLSTIYYGGSEKEWNEINISNIGNDVLLQDKENLKIYFNSDEELKNNIQVKRFTNWDEERQSACFDNTPWSYQLNENSDTAFLEQLDRLLGKYVLVEFDEENQDYIHSIRPLEEKWGTVKSINSNTITIDNFTYLNKASLLMQDYYLNQYVRYFILEDAIYRVDCLEQKKGILKEWNSASNQITILDPQTNTEKIYHVELTDIGVFDFLEMWLEREIVFYSLDGIIYQFETTKLAKLNAYDNSSKMVTFEDGTYCYVSPNAEKNIKNLLGKWAICKLNISADGVEEITDFEAVEANLEVKLILEYNQLTYKNGKFSIDGVDFKNANKISLPFVVDIRNILNISEDDFLLYQSELQTDKILSLVTDSFNLKLPEGFSYEWIDGKSFENGKVLKPGDVWIIGGTLKLKPEYTPENGKEEFAINSTITTNKGKSSSNASFTIVGQDYRQWIEETSQALEKVAQETAKVNYISLDLGTLLTKEQSEKLNIALAQWVMTVLDMDVSDNAKKLLYDSYEYDSKSKTIKSTYIITIHIDNVKYPKKGERQFEFQFTYNNYDYILENWNPSNSSITWRMLDTKGINMYGAGTNHILYTDANADLTSMSKVIKEALKKAKEGVEKGIDKDLGFSLNVFNEALDEMAENSKDYLMLYAVNLTKEWITANFWGDQPDYAGSIKNTTKKIINKMVKIKCPVDVYVYHEDKLIGLVKDNQVDNELEKDFMGSYVSVEGDIKTVYLPDNTYSIKLIGNDTGTMDYIIYEYIDTLEPSRTVYFDNLPLEKDKVYTGNLNEGENIAVSTYALTTDGEVIEADYDTARGDMIIDKPDKNKPDIDNNNTSSDNTGTNTGSSHGGGGSSGRSRTSSGSQVISIPATPGYWILDNLGWKFMNLDGGIYTNTWIYVNNCWYRINPEGYMLESWAFIDHNWYYLMPISGEMKTGWIFDKVDWYYLDENGVMKTGWIFVNGSWYYLGVDGRLLLNTTTPDGYQVDGNGKWIN